MDCKISDAADAMHRELLRQVEDLMGSNVGTPNGETLARLSALVEAYEQTRWPVGCDHIPMQAALDASVACIRCGRYLGEAN